MNAYERGLVIALAPATSNMSLQYNSVVSHHTLVNGSLCSSARVQAEYNKTGRASQQANSHTACAAVWVRSHLVVGRRNLI